MKTPKLLAVASAVDLDFRYGCTPAWWQLWKGMYEAGVDLVVTPYRGRPVESPWWRVAPNPTYREGESYQKVRDVLARLNGDRYLRRDESSPEESGFDRLTRETIRRWVTPRWKRHLERLIERERPDAVLVFTVPMAHLAGVPEALRARFGIPIVFYDGDVPMSLPEYGGMDTGFNPYHGADPWEYDLVVSNSEGAIPRLLELGARRAEALFWGADPEFFSPQPVEKEVDVFFYGYGDKFRREWMKTMVGEPSRAAPELDVALGGLDFQRRHGGRTAARRRPLQRLRARDLLGARQPQHHAAPARDRRRLVDRTPLRARLVRRGDRLEPPRGHRALVRAGPRARRRRERRGGGRCVPRARRGPRPGRGDGAARAGARPRRAHVRAPREAAARARRARGRGDGVTRPRAVAVVPAFNESGAIGRCRRRDPRGASRDRRRRGRRCVDGRHRRGRGGARRDRPAASVQRRHRRRRADRASATRSTRATSAPSGWTVTDSTTPSEIGRLLEPLERGEADLVIGSRFVDGGGSYRPPFARRLGIRVFARLVSLLGGQRVTDTTSGFIALDRAGIELFAREYPHDYPEVEATLVALRSGLRLAQVQVEMRERDDRRLLDHVRPLALLHRQGACSRCSSPACAAIRGSRGRAGDARSRLDRRRRSHPSC